jgi:hypothetical protein
MDSWKEKCKSCDKRMKDIDEAMDHANNCDGKKSDIDYALLAEVRALLKALPYKYSDADTNENRVSFEKTYNNGYAHAIEDVSRIISEHFG